MSSQKTSHVENPCRPTAQTKTIHCLEGLIDLIVGDASAKLPDDEKITMFAEYMISKTYFFSPEVVNRRHQEILNMLSHNEKLPVRFSSKKHAYCQEDGSTKHFKNKTEAKDFSTANHIYYKIGDRLIPVFIDKDGNYEVRRVIEEYSGARVSQGAKRSNVTSAVISHIWGNAFNPIFFSNLWNIAIVPDYLNAVLDKSQNGDERLINYTNKYYKNYLYKLYDLGSKIKDYKNHGIDIRSICNLDESIEVNSNNKPHYIDEFFKSCK